MFVLSLCLFLFSLYVAVLRQQAHLQGQETLTNREEMLPITNIQTGNIPYQEDGTGDQEPSQVQILPPQQG